MLPVACVNGPNLDLLGSRQPDVYGAMTLDELEASVTEWGSRLGFEVECFQSNDESELIEALHRAGGKAGVILNPGALTHTSAALGDAVASVAAPVVEVHLSNVRSRDRWRRRSYVTPVAAATIFGRHREGYRAGLRHLANRRSGPFTTRRYGPHPDQVYDLRPGSSRIGVVLVHGGFWLDAWGRDTTESWAADLAVRGIPSANLEYRRLGSGGGLVATLSDVIRGTAAAVADLGTSTTVAIGHSAGAHLLLAAAARAEFSFDAVGSVGGVLDLEEAAREGRGDGAAHRFDPSGATSPLSLSPPVPVILAHGGSDRTVPVSHSQQYAAHLEARGVEHRLTVIDQAGHFDALDSASPVWRSIWSGLAEVLSTSGFLDLEGNELPGPNP